MEKYNLEDARKYSEEIASLARLQDFDTSKVSQSLKALAEAKDEVAFRRIIDSYVRCAKTSTGDSIRKEPLAFLEWLCIGLDHTFTAVGFEALLAGAGIKREKLPLRQTQKFFQELYGSHFYYDPLCN